ncbi:MAG: CoA transferase [Actinomycetota bacterium]|nr:CoA transferase [Actinomycetota bacterium]
MKESNPLSSNMQFPEGLDTRPGPLEGMVVLDLSRAMAGPYATLMLADAGALVIKVEQPGKGDDSRGWGPPFVGPDGALESTYFLSVNRNKLSIELDISSPDGRLQLEQLVQHADVLVENFRPETRERLNLGDHALEAINTRLVVLSITGFGEGGPDGHRAGYDQILQGEAGLMSITGPTGGPLTKVGVPICDILAGMFGAFGVIAALYERERSGMGQVVRTSLLEAVLAVHTYQATRWLVAGEIPCCEGNRHPTISPYGAYECADSSINIAVGSEKLWRDFAPLVGIDPSDPRFVSNTLRRTNQDELDALIESKLRTAPAADWIELLNKSGVPTGRIRTLDEVYEWGQVHHLGMIDRVTHSLLGEVPLPGPPLSFSRSARGVSLPPPLLGQHSEIIAQWLEGWRTRN